MRRRLDRRAHVGHVKNAPFPLQSVLDTQPGLPPLKKGRARNYLSEWRPQRAGVGLAALGVR